MIYLTRLEQEILTALGDDRAYGLEIMDRLNRARKIVKMKPMAVGSMYITLARMTDSGLLEVEKIHSRSYYKASPLGSASLQGMIAYRQQLEIRRDRSGEIE